MTQGIIRRGGQLLRPMGSWSPAVHEYLRHLESAGFAGAPRFIGTDGNRSTAIGYHRSNGEPNIARATRRANRRPHDLINAVTSATRTQ